MSHLHATDLVQKTEENHSFIKATQFPLQEYQLISLVKYEHVHVCVCVCLYSSVLKISLTFLLQSPITPTLAVRYLYTR